MTHLLGELGEYMSVWYTSRASGLTAYMLLFFSMVAGLMQGSTWSKGNKGKRKLMLNHIHQWSGWFGLLFGMVHGLVLVYDDYVGYSLYQILIPFTASQDPFLTGLGTIAMYLMILIVATSDWMKNVGRKVWRAIHFLAMPTYLLALSHGVFLGTDSSSGLIQTMYISTAGVVIVLFCIRMSSIITAVKAKKNKNNIIKPNPTARA